MGSSHEIIKIHFPLESLPDPENAGRQDVRIELNKIFLSLPDVPVIAKKVMKKVGLSRVYPQLTHWDS
jgi:hypothetical protein